MSFDNERLARDLLTRLEDRLPGNLSTVEALWGGSHPMSLPSPVTYYLGHKPTVLEEPSAFFPFIAVLVPAREPRERPSRWGYQEQEVTVYVDFFVVAGDEASVNVIALRYGEALVLLLQEELGLGGYLQADYEPAVSLSEAARHGQTPDSDMFDPSQVDFIQGGRVTAVFHGG